jgi:hypothetical protein
MQKRIVPTEKIISSIKQTPSKPTKNAAFLQNLAQNTDFDLLGFIPYDPPLCERLFEWAKHIGTTDLMARLTVETFEIRVLAARRIGGN